MSTSLIMLEQISEELIMSLAIIGRMEVPIILPHCLYTQQDNCLFKTGSSCACTSKQFKKKYF